VSVTGILLFLIRVFKWNKRTQTIVAGSKMKTFKIYSENRFLPVGKVFIMVLLINRHFAEQEGVICVQ
jgi:hypothetical protein